MEPKRTDVEVEREMIAKLNKGHPVVIRTEQEARVINSYPDIDAFIEKTEIH